MASESAAGGGIRSIYNGFLGGTGRSIFRSARPPVAGVLMNGWGRKGGDASGVAIISFARHGGTGAAEERMGSGQRRWRVHRGRGVAVISEASDMPGTR